jgi:hypothetical protein
MAICSGPVIEYTCNVATSGESCVAENQSHTQSQSVLCITEYVAYLADSKGSAYTFRTACIMNHQFLLGVVRRNPKLVLAHADRRANFAPQTSERRVRKGK